MKKCLPYLFLLNLLAFKASAQTITVNTTGFTHNLGTTYIATPLTSIFTVTADSLTDSLTISLASGAPFGVSTGIDYSSSFRLGGTISGIDIFVQFKPTALGTYQDTVYLSSPGAATQAVPISGTCVNRPQISFAMDSLVVSENSGISQVAIKITDPNVNPTSVKVQMLTGTAIPELDFNVWVNGDTSNINPVFSATFPSNSSADQVFEIKVIDNNVAQVNRSVKFILTNLGNGAVLGSSDTLELIIKDNDFRKVTICDLKGQNAQGIADSLGKLYEIRGVAYGIDVRSASLPGYQFTLIDSAGCGIAIYNTGSTFPYTVRQGDSMVVRGRLSQLNGLRQLDMIDTLGLLALFRPLKAATVVNRPSETGESNLLRINNMMLSDTNGSWTYGTHKAYVVGIADTFLINIANEANNLIGKPKPKEKFYMLGIGGQSDSTSPYTSGYQIFPRDSNDIVVPKDSLSRFYLTTPVDSASFTIQGLPIQLISFNWTSSIPMTGVATPLYTFMVDQIGANFTFPEFSNASSNGGTSTNYAWSYNSIVGFLTNEGVVVGQTVMYQWTVKAQSGTYSRMAHESHVISFLRETMASANNVSKEVIMLYPNPAEDKVFLMIDEPIATIALYTMDGKQVNASFEQVDPATVSIATQNLAPGLYQLQLTNQDGELFIGKFLKK